MFTQSPSLTACDREPIHTPGAIQAFGALAIVDPSTLRVIQVSENTESVFGAAPSALLGKDVREVFGTAAEAALQKGARSFRGDRFSANVWRNDGVWLVEAEALAAHSEFRAEQVHLDRLQSAETLQSLLEQAALAVGEVTGLDRVMVYRFHEDLHGEVVAEHTRPGVESYFGLHYPATDIPAPARAVFLKNWVRMIPDVAYRAVALRPAENPLTGKPLDLGTSLLRAVSPIHIEYLKNMGVGASLTISLVTHGKLWGLIACHALEAKYLPPQVRDACESIGRMTSAFIAIKDDLDLHRARERYRAVYLDLKERLHSGSDMSVELSRHSPNLLDLISATGSSAALYLDGYWVNVGETPKEDELNALVDWLGEQHPEEVVFTTDALPAVYPPAAKFSPAICGLLAVSIPKSSRNYIFWFRPERLRTVKWAGSPEKKPDAQGRLNPRASFDEWKETVTGRSAPWSAVEKEAALELRNAVMAVDLQRQFVKEQSARADAERAMLAREELMNVLSHDLKNPLSSIKLGSKVASKLLTTDTFPRVKEFLDRIDRTTSSMDALISDILSITKMEAGRLEVTAKNESVGDILREVVDLLSPLAQEKEISLVCDVPEVRCHASCDRSRLIQVLSNLLGNAIKFTPNHGRIRIHLESCGPEFVKISVADTGPGVPPEDLKNIFDRFWQAQKTRRLGTGLGLAIAKGIVEAHGGEIWAESDGRTGTTFHLTLPLPRNERGLTL